MRRGHRLGGGRPAGWRAVDGARENRNRFGSGRQGGTLGLLFAKAGHEVLFPSRHPEELKDLVVMAGPKARAGLPEEAARFGESDYHPVCIGTRKIVTMLRQESQRAPRSTSVR